MQALHWASAAMKRGVVDCTSFLAQHCGLPSPSPSHTPVPHHASRLSLPPLQPTKTTGVVTPFSFSFSSVGVVSLPSPSAAITGGVGSDFAAGGGGGALCPRIVRSKACASISRSTSLRWRTPWCIGAMIGGQQRRALSRSVALLAKMTGPIAMSGGGGDWQKKVKKAEKELEKAEKTCAGKEKKYAVAQVKLEEYAAAYPSNTTSDMYSVLEKKKVTARVASEAAQLQVVVAQGELAVARAGKTCAEKEDKCKAAHMMEKYAAANPGYATLDQYNELQKATATAKAAYEVAQGELAVAEKEKDYEVAQKKLEAYASANPDDTTSARYVRLATAKERAYKAAQLQVVVVRREMAVQRAEKTRVEREKCEGAREKYEAANPGDTTSAYYVTLATAEERAYAAYEEAQLEEAVVQRCLAEARAEVTYAEEKEELAKYVVANPDDTTSARYVRLATAKERAYKAAQLQVVVVRREMAVQRAEKTRVEREKCKGAREKYEAANPGDTTSAYYVTLATAEERAYAAYEEAQLEEAVVQRCLAEARAEVTYAEEKEELAKYVVANPDDTSSDGYKDLSKKEVIARQDYETELTQVRVAAKKLAVWRATKDLENAKTTYAEDEKDHEVARKKLEEYAVTHPCDTTSDDYDSLKRAVTTASDNRKTTEERVKTRRTILTEAEDVADVVTPAVCRLTHVCSQCHTLPLTGTRKVHCCPCGQGCEGGDAQY